MRKRWIALILALCLTAAVFSGCAKKTDIPANLEQTQTEQEQTPPEQEKEPASEETTKPEEQKPAADENTAEEEEPAEEEPELTEEQKRQQTVEKRVNACKIWGKADEFDNFFTEEAVKSNLTRFLTDNWDSFAPAISTYLEADDGKANLYQNSLAEYVCVLSHTDSFQELYIRIDAFGASVFTPNTNVQTANVSEEIAALVDSAKFDKRHDGYYFGSQPENETFRAYSEQAVSAFQKTLEENKKTWKPILDDAFRATVSFDENDQFVFDLQCNGLYWLELRYVPGRGVWSDVSLVTNETEDWELDASALTDDYLLSLVTPMEVGMTAVPFTFERPGDLTQEQLWLCYLLLTPDSVREAAYQKQDKMYHITKDEMLDTLTKYFKNVNLDITKDRQYDAKTGEIVTPLVSGFGGGRLAKLREKTVAGNTVTFTVDYYSTDDTSYTTVEAAKTYTVTFRYGGYFYDSAVETPA